MKRIVLVLSFPFLLCANEYEFSLDELDAIETKSYEYGGYIEAEHRYQEPREDKERHYYSLETLLNYRYFSQEFSFFVEGMGFYERVDSKEQSSLNLNEAYVNYKFDTNQQLYAGKKSARWGKGYYFNPVAFIDRKKDPNDPQRAREGYTQLAYQYNKVLESDLQNLTFDLVYLRTQRDLNDDLNALESDLIALKSYFLYKDIDIDLIYLYNSQGENKFGVDFSMNLQTNFELHGEYALYDTGYSAYLLGIKYLTESELSILSEWYEQSEMQSQNEPFWDKRYWINSFTQKEPFDFLYLSLYYKNILNASDHSMQHKIGMIYTRIENLEIDLSFIQNSGKTQSEFAQKALDSFTWLELNYSF